MQKHLKRNFILHLVDGSFFFLALSLISIHTVLPVMLNRLGASAFIIGMIPFIDTLIFNMSPLFSAHLAEKAKHKKRFVITAGAIQRVIVLLSAAAIFLSAKQNQALLVPIVLFFVGAFAFTCGFIVPAWADLIGRTIPKEMRGRLFSIRNVIGHILAIGGSTFIAWALSTLSFPNNYTLLFLAAFACMMISFAGLAFVKDNISEAPPSHAPTFGAYLKEALSMLKSDHNFLAFNIARSFIAFSMGATVFFSAYGMKKFSLPDSYAGVFTGVCVGSFIIVSPLIGWWGDLKGNKQPVVFGQAMLGIASLTAIFASTIHVYLIAFAAMAIVQVVLFISALNMTLEFFSPEKSPTTIAITGAFAAPVAIVVLLLGKCAELTSYNTIFYTMAVLSLISTTFSAFCMHDPRRNASRI